MSDTNKKSGGSARAPSPAQAADPAKRDAGGAKGAAATDGPGKFWVNWFDPRALAVLGVLLIALCCVAAVIALWANNAAQPVAITRPASGAALEVGKLGDVEGTAAPGAQIKLFDGPTPLGEARADSSGHWNFGLPAGLSAGGHTLRVDALDAGNRLTSATVAWTLIDPSAIARATEKPTIPAPTALPPTPVPPTPAPPALLAPTFGVLPGIFPPANPLKETPAGVKGAAYETVTELAGTAGPNARVRLFDGDKVIGETTADARGNWSIKIATPFALGPHSITAAAVEGAAIGPRSVRLDFTFVSAQAAAVAPTMPAEPTKLPEPTKAIEPTKAVTAALPVPAATLAPTKAPEPTIAPAATVAATKAAPSAAPTAAVAATKAPEATRVAPTIAPTATVAATKAPEATRSAITATATTTAAATRPAEATKAPATATPTAIATKPPAAAATATAAPTQSAEATKILAQAATAAPTKAPVLTPTPRVLLGVTGEQPEAGTSLPIVIGAAAVLALAAMALARRRIR